MRKIFVGFLLVASLICGCRSVYYSAWEKLGKQKRDLLHTKVQQVKDSQTEAAQQLKDALTRLQEMYGFQGGKLEQTYKNLQSDYDKSVSKANTLHSRIKQMDQIAHDLFAEWSKEADTITTQSLRQQSLNQLRETQNRYDTLYAATTRAEKSIEPVLTKLHDYVLFLKHNLNAQAIGSLQGEASKIQADIGQLIKDMNASIQEADAFIKANQ